MVSDAMLQLYLDVPPKPHADMGEGLQRWLALGYVMLGWGGCPTLGMGSISQRVDTWMKYKGRFGCYYFTAGCLLPTMD